MTTSDTDNLLLRNPNISTKQLVGGLANQQKNLPLKCRSRANLRTQAAATNAALSLLAASLFAPQRVRADESARFHTMLPLSALSALFAIPERRASPVGANVQAGEADNSDAEQVLLLDDADDEGGKTVIAVRNHQGVPSSTQSAKASADTTTDSAAPPRIIGPFAIDKMGGFQIGGSTGILSLYGGVRLTYTAAGAKTTTTLNAESAEYDPKTGLLTAHNGARLDRPDGSFIAQELTFNVVTNAGFAVNAIAESDYFRMRGDRIEANADGTYTVENGVFTTCIRGRPDYQIRAKRLTIHPNRFVTASGVTPYAGPTKLITLPSLRRNLNSKSEFLAATPGYNKSEGIFARVHDTPILESRRSLEFDGHVDFRRLPSGFVAYEFDLKPPALKSPPPRSLRQTLSDPLHGFLEQLTPPTYREYAEDRYEDEFTPRMTAGAILQNDQYVYNRRRTDLRVSRFPEFNLRLVNVLGHARDAQPDLQGPRNADGTPTAPGGATINTLLQRASSAPFLLDFNLEAGGVTEYPTRVTSGKLGLTTTAATQPILLGRRLSLRFGVTDWLNAYSTGSLYNLFSPETELDYLPTSTTRLGIAYRFTDDLGRTPFAFDHLDVRHELRLLLQTGGPYAFGVESKFDLERSRAYDSELAFLRNFDCMQVGIAYRLRTQQFSLIFNLLPPVRDRATRRAAPLQGLPGSRPPG